MTNDKHTFGNLVSPLSNHMHQLLNLWCDFPEHRTDATFPQQWSEQKQQEFIDRVVKNSRKKFDQFGYYFTSEGKLNWTANQNNLR